MWIYVYLFQFKCQYILFGRFYHENCVLGSDEEKLMKNEQLFRIFTVIISICSLQFPSFLLFLNIL